MRKITLFFLCQMLLLSAFGQDRTITGKVTDDNGSPIPNASVIIKGTKTGTVTRADGTFSLTIHSNAKTLVVSSVNFEEKLISLGSNSAYNVSLLKTEKSMSEVVIVAYGTQRKVNVTGSIGTVKGAEIENQPFTSIDKALQGQVAGLQSV